jgi:hypothetical protein
MRSAEHARFAGVFHAPAKVGGRRVVVRGALAPPRRSVWRSDASHQRA